MGVNVWTGEWNPTIPEVPAPVEIDPSGLPTFKIQPNKVNIKPLKNIVQISSDDPFVWAELFDGAPYELMDCSDFCYTIEFLSGEYIGPRYTTASLEKNLHDVVQYYYNPSDFLNNVGHGDKLLWRYYEGTPDNLVIKGHVGKWNAMRNGMWHSSGTTGVHFTKFSMKRLSEWRRYLDKCGWPIIIK